MKHRSIMIVRLCIAVLGATSLGLTFSVRAAEKEAKPSESKTERGSLSAADKKFVENAAKGGMMEVA